MRGWGSWKKDTWRWSADGKGGRRVHKGYRFSPGGAGQPGSLPGPSGDAAIQAVAAAGRHRNRVGTPPKTVASIDMAARRQPGGELRTTTTA